MFSDRQIIFGISDIETRKRVIKASRDCYRICPPYHEYELKQSRERVAHNGKKIRSRRGRCDRDGAERVLISYVVLNGIRLTPHIRGDSLFSFRQPCLAPRQSLRAWCTW